MNRVCDECLWSNREHAEWCQSRGYASVGPHPNAPVPETEPQLPFTAEEMCCGGTCVRALCPYHGGEVKASAPCESDSWGDPEDPCNPLAFHRTGFTGRELTACGHYVQTFRDGKIVDEEPIEAYAIDVTVALVCAHLKSQGLLSEGCTVEVTGGDAASNRIDMRVTLTSAIENVVVNGSIEL